MFSNFKFLKNLEIEPFYTVFLTNTSIANTKIWGLGKIEAGS